MSLSEIFDFMKNRGLGRSIAVLLGVAFAALLVTNIATWLLIDRMRADNNLVEHTYEVRDVVKDVLAAAIDAENGARGYLITKDESYLVGYRAAIERTPTLLDQLYGLTVDNADQRGRIAQLQPLLKARYDVLSRVVESGQRGDERELENQIRMGRGKTYSNEIRALLRRIDAEETRLLAIRQARSAGAATVTTLANGLGGALILAAAVISLLLFRRYIREIQSSRDQLDRMNQGLEQKVAVRTEDLTRANEEIQRFAYIVSHDLRAPLVNVMGYTSELQAASKSLERQIDTIEAKAPEHLDPDAVLAVREDVPEAIGFIRTSTAKMDSLINAILRLSREGRRNLHIEPVNMTAAVQAIADSVRHQTEQAGAEIKVEMLPQVISDRLSLEQIFGNLIDNAVKYLDPSRPGLITVRGRLLGETHVQYEIEDNGRGIAPRDHERVFELFRRAGVQDRVGEGLGLAFVKNSVRRLGGVIDLKSELGKGSTFILKFPKRLAAERRDTE